VSGTTRAIVPDRPPGPAPKPLTVSGLLLLDPHGHDPTPVDSITFDDDGIGVVRTRGEAPRVLRWDAVVTHAVEPWAGGVIPAWWVGRDPAGVEPVDGAILDFGTTDGGRSGSLPHAEAGALISIQTRAGTYRFLRSGGDPSQLAERIAALAVRHRGPVGASSVTTVVSGRHRRGRARSRSTWDRARPVLVVLLILVIAASVTLILLQSAGVIHLPILGGGPQPSPQAVPLSR
jgi:hypothetical protein